MDLADWYARGRIVGLLDLIDQLPDTARLREAVLNDPEQAELIAAMPKPDAEEQPWTPRLTDWDLNAQLLTQIHGMLGSIFQQLIGNIGKTPPTIDPLPSPVTEVDKARQRIETDHVMWLVNILTPER